MKSIAALQFAAFLAVTRLLVSESAATIRAADTCRSVVLQGEVAHGLAWERDLPGGLVFRLAPGVDPSIPGWTLEVRSGDLPEPENELSWVATPPYRFWNPRYLDVSYGLTAREVVDRAERRFGIVHAADYARAAHAVRTLLWPAGRSDRELANAERTLDTVRRGHGVLNITGAELSDTPGGRGRIEQLRFTVALCLPSDRTPER